ncbi:RluA family pseudouridine synthase [Desulfosporosinus sp. BICA1-9]|uniref:RluA family pseudouridine synthase n=1 Tax=Desulfosporosinus sp. BICA1-9 TaxID=1531958 RepID=UPI00054B3276|nr:RluA family pseudouridine synthase [Desulfosporosinus sp. BICA1-9]KJS50722.1 MAG: pseudouridylate synthase [Peptococcaceae bacterium BRH_c23]KJS82396.1 MAG: pseudouridylate synthase [Desulfosporosinus sp. BICA1-9]HBW38844.1 RluA family pseudouridine synthase [Desulfosporosinus sp.]
MHTPSSKLRTKTGKDKQSHLEVTEQAELMKFLLGAIPSKSRSDIKSLLAHRQISVDNEVITQYNHPLEIGQQVVVNWAKVLIEKQPDGLDIVYEDPDIIIIEKQAGLLSIATATEKEQTAYSILSNHVKKRDPKNKIFVLHRLDRETSGVMMFAKSEKVQQLLQEAWKEAVLERTYVVVVEGAVSKEQGTITSWLTESKAFIMYSSRTPNDGQKAVTHYRLLKKNKHYSLLEVKLETGRKNQIRVHMRDIGHSVIGDKKYGATKHPIGRIGLHAQVLAFKHPITGEVVRYESEIPKSFLNLFP